IQLSRFEVHPAPMQIGPRAAKGREEGNRRVWHQGQTGVERRDGLLAVAEFLVADAERVPGPEELRVSASRLLQERNGPSVFSLACVACRFEEEIARREPRHLLGFAEQVAGLLFLSLSLQGQEEAALPPPLRPDAVFAQAGSSTFV